MPGHVDGITASAYITVASKDPMTYTNADWERLEKAIERGLKTMKIRGHRVTGATVAMMMPTASTISKHGHRDTRRKK